METRHLHEDSINFVNKIIIYYLGSQEDPTLLRGSPATQPEFANGSLFETEQEYFLAVNHRKPNSKNHNEPPLHNH